MSYCTKQDVINDFKSLVVNASGTVITNDYLDSVISEESNFIDGYIAQRYVLPIQQSASPKAFQVLKRICVFRVSERVRNKIEVRSNSTQAASDEKFSENKIRTPNDDLREIAAGNLILVDAPVKSKALGVASFTSSSKGTCAMFDVNKQQW